MTTADTFRPADRPRAGRLFAALAIGATLTLSPFVVLDTAEARVKGGFGSRGAKTYQAPPPTATAPRTAAPIERSATPAPQQQAPGAGMNQAARPGFFNGFGRTMLAGLAVGGLIGLLLGNGLGGLAGFVGLLLQVGLIALGVMLLMRFIRGRQAQPAHAGAAPHAGPASSGGEAMGRHAHEASHGPLGGLGGLGGLRTGSPSPGATPAYRPGPSQPSDALGLGTPDFDTFERLLGEVQTAYGRGDREALRAVTTPEAFAHLSEQLEADAARGVVNEISDVRLLQGDLAEAWREGLTEYATVAMRVSMIDVTRDRASGRVLEGDPNTPDEVTQVWTFVRERGIGGGPEWRLSAVQDA